MIRGRKVAREIFVFGERFLVSFSLSSFEQAEHARITAEVVVLSRLIRQELKKLYESLLVQLRKEDIVDGFKKELGSETDKHKQRRRKFIERIVLGIAENKKSLITLDGLLAEFESQTLEGENFGHIFLAKFGELLAHKSRNCATAGRLIPRKMRQQTVGPVMDFESAIDPILRRIKNLSDEREVEEPTSPTKLSCQHIANLIQEIIRKLNEGEDEKEQFCLLSSEIESFFDEVNLSRGETSLLRRAFYYLAIALKSTNWHDDQPDFEGAASSLLEIIRDPESNAKNAPHKLLALHILQHFQVSQGANGAPDFVLKSLRELRKMAQNTSALVKIPDLNLVRHVLAETERVAPESAHFSF